MAKRKEIKKIPGFDYPDGPLDVDPDAKTETQTRVQGKYPDSYIYCSKCDKKVKTNGSNLNGEKEVFVCKCGEIYYHPPYPSSINPDDVPEYQETGQEYMDRQVQESKSKDNLQEITDCICKIYRLAKKEGLHIEMNIKED